MLVPPTNGRMKESQKEVSFELDSDLGFSRGGRLELVEVMEMGKIYNCSISLLLLLELDSIATDLRNRIWEDM